jgi:hypothetical protein
MEMILELRQYSLVPGRRDELIELFDREFVESQEACGMRILGQFRDLDDPDRFVWLRGFPDMASRLKALNEFYTGPVWKAHSAKANATMVDVSDVLLLRPATPFTGFASTDEGSVFLATIYYRDEPFDERFLAEFDREIGPLLPSQPLACLQTEHSENNFPALPVRSGENAFVFLTRFDDVAQLDGWKHPETIPLARQELRLAPTAGSRLR